MSKYYSSSIAFGAEQTKTEQVVVSPTKIGNVTTDAVSGALTVDEVPVLNSLNPVSSDGVARAVIQAGAEIPTRGSEDTGKVLTVANSDGDLEWDTPEGGIPDMTGKNGKVLGAVDNGGTMEAQWVNPPDSYPSVTGNAGKVLKVNAGATGVEWANESTVTVDQTYNASSTNPQSGTAVAGALETIKQVPAASSGDFDKILGVTDTSGTVGWVSKPASVSVDQNYNPYSENPQSGTAVAGALSTIKQVPASTSADENKVLSVNAQGAPEWVTPSGGTQYSAGDGIGIDANNVISADVDGVTIGIDSTTKKIKSLQSIPSKTSDLQNDSGFITSSDIPAQVNADWTSNSGASEILHKPDLSIYAQSANLATVATTGSYDDLVNKPTIPAAQVNSDWNASSGKAEILNKPTLSTVATTGDYDDLVNKPSIPAAQVNADWDANSGVSQILNKPSLATVATTGAYSDLSGTPAIPSVDQTYNASSTNAQSGVAVAGAIAGVNQVPSSTSSDENKVLTVNSSGTPVWAASSVPASKPLVAGSNITITENTNDVTIAATDTTYTAGDGIDITSGVVSADVDGSTIGIDSTTKKIKLLSTIPTVDQTYSASSANAQSGVAVASAISGINAVPASTSADQDKVLTVNSSGTPVWAAAQGGGGGSGGDSEFPYDPGYMHTGWNKMVVRFGDTTYDPTNKTSASSFTSIVALNEPGVYEYTFNLSSSHGSRLFQYEWNDITNNPVDILQLTSDDQLMGSYYTALFAGCSGLRSVWNFRGYFGAALGWFRECPNLEIASGKIPERIDAINNSSYTTITSVCIKLTYNAGYMFYGCTKLKKAELVLAFTSSASSNSVISCFEGDVRLQVGAAVIGFVADASYAYKDCHNMARLYGESDEPRLLRYFVDDYNPKVAGFESSLNTNIEQMFSGCSSFTDFNGVTLRYGKVSNMSYAFSGCRSIKVIPSFNIATTNGGQITVSADYAFAGCASLEQIPDIPYNRIKSASFLFSYCINLTDLTPILSIATTSIENVTGICQSTYLVSRGALELYNALSTTSVNILSYDYAFSDCGECGWNDVRSQIPSSWGGMGA